MNLESAARQYLQEDINLEPKAELDPLVTDYIMGQDGIFAIQGGPMPKVQGKKVHYSDFANEMARLLRKTDCGIPIPARAHKLHVLNSHLYFLSPEERERFYLDRTDRIDDYHEGIATLHAPVKCAPLTTVEENIFRSKGPYFDEPFSKRDGDSKIRLMRAKAAFDMATLYFRDEFSFDLDSILAQPERTRWGRYDWLHRYFAERIMTGEPGEVRYVATSHVSDRFLQQHTPGLEQYIGDRLQVDYPTHGVPKRVALEKGMRHMYGFGVGMATYGLHAAKDSDFGNNLQGQINTQLRHTPIPSSPLSFEAYSEDGDEGEQAQISRNMLDLCPGMQESYAELGASVARELSDPEAARYTQQQHRLLMGTFDQGMLHALMAHQREYPSMIDELGKKDGS